VLYAPGGEGDALYREIVESPDRSRLYRSLGVDLAPPVDDAPFFEHYVLYGSHRLDPALPPEFAFFDRFKLWGLVPHGDIAYVVILVESAVLATLLIGWPLWLDRGRRSGRFGLAVYFAGLGAGFILIELCLMKSVVLFLGHPGYSISVVLFTLLAGAAMGSFASARLPSPRLAIAILVPLMLVEIVAMPVVFRYTLGLEFAGRVVVAILLLLPLAISMGMPFPVAFRILRQCDSGAQPLAWAMNGYGTVLGSGLCVFLAVFLGFRATYLVACGIYLVAAAAFPARLGSARA
jgi:hypothetical protein